MDRVFCGASPVVEDVGTLPLLDHARLVLTGVHLPASPKRQLEDAQLLDGLPQQRSLLLACCVRGWPDPGGEGLDEYDLAFGIHKQAKRCDFCLGPVIVQQTADWKNPAEDKIPDREHLLSVWDEALAEVLDAIALARASEADDDVEMKDADDDADDDGDGNDDDDDEDVEY